VHEPQIALRNICWMIKTIKYNKSKVFIIDKAKQDRNSDLWQVKN
jgi:hypothetical protein